MPSKNSRKVYTPQSFYHIYNRGVEKRTIFIDNADYTYFLWILERHLSAEDSRDSAGRPYTKYSNDVTLVAYCLMPNHFHLLLYQYDSETAITKLMSSVSTAYTMYFNKKYQRVGHLFQDRFKASHISTDMHVQHISRYIHLNPRNYKSYKWSSLDFYSGSRHASWIKPDLMLNMFNSIDEYMSFVADYEGQMAMLNELKYELANL